MGDNNNNKRSHEDEGDPKRQKKAKHLRDLSAVTHDADADKDDSQPDTGDIVTKEEVLVVLAQLEKGGEIEMTGAAGLADGGEFGPTDKLLKKAASPCEADVDLPPNDTTFQYRYTEEEEAQLRKKKEMVLWQAGPDDEECGRYPCFCGCECDVGITNPTDSDDE
jgi:hypothetical protein